MVVHRQFIAATLGMRFRPGDKCSCRGCGNEPVVWLLSNGAARRMCSHHAANAAHRYRLTLINVPVQQPS